MLPVIEDPATAACAGCAGDCCTRHTVTMSGYDVWRLSRGLGLPWHALAELDQERSPIRGGFRLDRGPVHHHFLLKRHASGACRLLLELDGHRRCGAHALRPGACRIYPLALHGEAAELGAHAVCPPERAARYAAAAAALTPLLDDDAAEDALYLRLLERWDLSARTTPIERPRTVEELLGFVDRAYRAVEPLRQSERGAWQLQAYAIFDQLPVP